jgi:hypothetical protein
MKHRFAFAVAVATLVPMGVCAQEQARVFGVTEGVTYQAAPKAIRDRFTPPAEYLGKAAGRRAKVVATNPEVEASTIAWLGL